MSLAIPDPAMSSVDALHEVCFGVQAWADDCHDISDATEALARVAAVEAYLARHDLDGPAQEAARWLEVRIGELLGPAVNGGNRKQEQLRRDVTALSHHERHDFRRLAEHRNIVAEMVPCSRAAVLKAIKRAAVFKPEGVEFREHNHDDEATPVAFPAVVIDPPWRYDNVATRGAAEDHYATMSLDELAALTIPAADDAHMYLWVTNSFLREGFDLLDAWGFTYKTILTWCKPQIGMGNWFRNSTEHVLFGVRGSLPTLRNDVPTHFVADRTRHSAKPESFYDLVETCSPGPWLEMFARRRRFAWSVWGAEA